MKTSVATIGLASVVVLLALNLRVDRVETLTGGTVDIGVAGRANSFASIASDGSFVGVAWAARTADGATDIYTAISRDAGRTFGAPVQVNKTAGDASVSGEQPPRIVLSGGRSNSPAVVVLWTAKAESGTRLVSARSSDGGHSFGPASAVPGSEAAGNRGWESAAVTPQGEVMAVWLDHREVPARTPGAEMTGAHQHGAASPRPPADGVARGQLSQIFFARLDDAASVRSIAPGVCYCCKTSVATGPEGTVVAAWRHVYPGNIRDIALAESSDGGRTFAPPVRVSEDDWVLDGCPENGPSVAIDHENVIHVVWPTLIRTSAGEENLALFYASSTDRRRFTPRQRIPTEGVPRYPQLALGAAGAITVAWQEQLDSTRRVVIGHGIRDNRTAVRFVRQAVGDERGTYPAVAALADGAIAAWTTGTADHSVLRIARYPAAR